MSSFFECVYTFWENHPECWFPIDKKQKADADKQVSTFFCTPTETPISHKAKVGYIIFYDQFFRHFQRFFGGVTDNEIRAYRERLFIVPPQNEFEVVWIYMPLKHLDKYDDVLSLCMEWCSERMTNLKEHPLLSRFFCDTYKKAFTFETVRKNTQMESFEGYSSDPKDVCDFYPDERYTPYVPIPEIKYLTTPRILVSLSGGVDSMTLLYLLKTLKYDVVACHIVYGNRAESEQELEIVKEACLVLGVELYVYRIKYLRRGEIDRAFYESMTRTIRFNVYKQFDRPVVLGHIRDDMVENVWTNIARSQHVFDLKKMKERDVQDGVEILRPFLNVSKERVFEIAHTFGIPYLKNTTPAWCNRGKFRNTFHAQTREQYGKEVDSKILDVADTIHRAGAMIEQLLYKPMFESFCEGKMNITKAVEIGLTPAEWCRIFEYVCHTHLKVPKPSIHAVRQFTIRISKECVYIPMNKYFRVRVIKERDTYLVFEI